MVHLLNYYWDNMLIPFLLNQTLVKQPKKCTKFTNTVKLLFFNCQINTENHRSGSIIPNLNIIWSECPHFLQKEARRKPLVWKVQAQFYLIPIKRKKSEAYYPDISPPVELWNNRNQPKAICTNNQGPLQVSAGLYNRKPACHHKHNYSRFPANTKGTKKKKERWHY